MMQVSTLHSLSSWNAVSVAESLLVMMQKEQTVYRSCDYLHQEEPSLSAASLSPRVVDDAVRMAMVDWCYSFIDVCKFERETVAMAMEMVDRFMSKSSKESEAVFCDCMRFQLLTMTALYIALKIKTNGKTALDISSISRDLYTVNEFEVMEWKQFEVMEWKLLDELSWCVSAPTSLQMAHHILTLTSARVTLVKATEKFIRDEMTFQVEHAVRDYYFVTKRPSTVAIAAILNALELHSEKQESRKICRSLVHIMNDDFDSIEKILEAKRILCSLVYGPDAGDGDDSYRQVHEFT